MMCWNRTVRNLGYSFSSSRRHIQYYCVTFLNRSLQKQIFSEGTYTLYYPYLHKTYANSGNRAASKAYAHTPNK